MSQDHLANSGDAGHRVREPLDWAKGVERRNEGCTPLLEDKIPQGACVLSMYQISGTLEMSHRSID
jgi:hypothetical protein